ncbi:FAD:protein FMN transferase [Thiorhodovibrio winogradskyi]|nr:FAD:protein FMN transferase [Thiorhodovibrio winogradskyi]
MTVTARWAGRLQLGLALLLLGACGGPEPPGLLELKGRTMGTSYSVQVARPPSDLDRAALQQSIAEELARINARMSTYDPDSWLSRFNQSDSTDWFAVPPELARVVAEAQRISHLSGGAFDVSVGRLVNLWGFGPEFHLDRTPTPEAIAETLAVTGYHSLKVRADPPALRKTQTELYVDLSAIAKGYAVDRLAELLAARGVTDYLVEVGGELRAAGRHPQRPWRVAIERPANERLKSGGRAVFRVVPLRDVAMATSGDYRNFFEQDGVFYSHTIDPASGRPVDHRLASVSVLDESCMRADALATALLVLGPERGLALAKEQGIAAFFIERSESGYQARMSPAFEQLTAAPGAPNPSVP